MDLDAVRDRWEALQSADVLALRDAARERVAGWAYFPLGHRGHRPGAVAPPLLSLSEPAGQFTRVGHDTGGRAVLIEDTDGERVWRTDVITWSAEGAELLALRDDTLEELEVTSGPRTIATMGGARLDGRPMIEVTEHRPGLVLRVYESGADRSWGGPERGPYWGWGATRLTYADDGALLMKESVTPVRRDGIADGQGVEAALAAAFEAYEREPYTTSMGWDGRLLAPEDPVADPERVLDDLAVPFADAIQAAIPAGGPLACVVADVWLMANGDRPVVPRAAVVDVAFRDRGLVSLSSEQELIAAAFEARALPWLDHASPELLRRLRVALQSSPRPLPVAPLARALAAELDGRDWGAVDPAFAALVRVEERDAEAPTRDVVGEKRLQALHASLRPGRRRRGGELRLADRAELAAVLDEAGLPDEGAAKVVADATWGIVLLPGDEGRSRLGGRPLLAVDWPCTADGRRLTHLATLALDELPDVEGREVLPEDGHLSFFADLDDGEDGEWDIIEPDEEPDRFAVIHTPGDAAAEERDGPRLRERRVRPTARLQLRHVGFGYANRLYGLDAIAERALQGIVLRANGKVAQQLLGFPFTVQDDPRERGETSLLHLVEEPGWDLTILDAGSLHFFAAPADVRARRWDQVTLETSSC